MMLDADVSNVRFLMMANADVAEFTAQQGSEVTKETCKGPEEMPSNTTIGGLVGMM